MKINNKLHPQSDRKSGGKMVEEDLLDVKIG